MSASSSSTSKDLPFVKRKKHYIEVSSPEGMFTPQEPVADSAGRPITHGWDFIEASMKKHGDKNCLGVREVVVKKDKDKEKERIKLSGYKWISYSSVLEDSNYAGSALAEMGAKKNELCMIYGCNTPEFMVSVFGAIRQACVPMPLPYWASSTQLAGLIRTLGLRVMMCNAYLLPRFVRACEILEREDVPLTVKAVVILPTAPCGKDKLPEGYIEEQGKRFKWRTVVSWERFMKIGKRHKNPPHPCSSKDIFAVFQTSGTTGSGKAVAISNYAAISGCNAICSHPSLASGPIVHYCGDYLAYVGSFSFTLSVIRLGGCIGFPSYPYLMSDTLHDDIKALEPTHICTVPAFIYMNKHYATEASQSGNAVQRVMVKSALKENSTLGALFGAAQKIYTGGHLRHVCVGGGFLTPNALSFANGFMGRELIQAYGQSEYFGCGLVTPVATKDTSSDAFKSTCAGFCLPGTVVRIVDVPGKSQFGLSHNPPTGEMYIHSKSMFSGYLADSDATFSVLDDDGWFKSGDVAQLNPDGSISIIARLSADSKFNNGFFAQCSMMNQAYAMSSLCKHVFTYVRRDAAFTVAVVEVDIDALSESAMLPSSAREIVVKARANPQSLAAQKLLDMPEIHDLYVREFARIADDNQFNAFEVVRGVILDGHEWTAKNGFLTSSGKLCESELLHKFQGGLDKLVEDTMLAHPEFLEPMPKEEPDLTLF